MLSICEELRAAPPPEDPEHLEPVHHVGSSGSPLQSPWADRRTASSRHCRDHHLNL